MNYDQKSQEVESKTNENDQLSEELSKSKVPYRGKITYLINPNLQSSLQGNETSRSTKQRLLCFC